MTEAGRPFPLGARSLRSVDQLAASQQPSRRERRRVNFQVYHVALKIIMNFFTHRPPPVCRNSCHSKCLFPCHRVCDPLWGRGRPPPETAPLSGTSGPGFSLRIPAVVVSPLVLWGQELGSVSCSTTCQILPSRLALEVWSVSRLSLPPRPAAAQRPPALPERGTEQSEQPGVAAQGRGPSDPGEHGRRHPLACSRGLTPRDRFTLS